MQASPLIQLDHLHSASRSEIVYYVFRSAGAIEDQTSLTSIARQQLERIFDLLLEWNVDNMTLLIALFVAWPSEMMAGLDEATRARAARVQSWIAPLPSGHNAATLRRRSIILGAYDNPDDVLICLAYLINCSDFDTQMCSKALDAQSSLFLLH